MFKKDGEKPTAGAGTAMQPVDAERFPALAGGGEVAKALADNMGGEEVTVFDLDRVRIPGSGGTVWEVPDGDGGTTAEKFIDGVIVFTKIGRSFWATDFENSGGGSPPDCSSPDGRTGVGNPGGNCKTCAKAVFGSDEGGRAQACKQQRFVFLLRAGANLPTVLVLPPTSLKPMKQWLFQISGKGKRYWEFLTRFELVKRSNKGGIQYAEVKPTVVRELTPEELTSVRAFAERTAETFASYHEGAEADDGGGDPGDGDDGREPGE